jgi:hypothetical protein
MRRFIFCLAFLPIAFTLKAQKAKPSDSQNKTFQRCASDRYLQRLLIEDPTLRARLEDAEARLSRGMDEKLQQRKRQGNLRLSATVTIPVVVHIVLSNPNIVTDADVIWQINKMNIDFAGLNADSVNAGPFAPLFGHSQIQFCLAQQDPGGNPSNGIERITSTRNWDQDNFNELKHASNCGADSWDVTKYLNIWVGRSTDGTLGVATFPQAGLNPEQGVVLAHEAFGNNPAYVASEFDLGRTAVHETGHYFFARHIWGDGGGCQSDFPVVSGLVGSWVDDTPTQSGATTNCPTGTQPAGCGSPNPPGKMYQNYMDYTQDKCYCMFTKNQVLRMEAALEIFRASLLTSDKCTPATIFTNDAALDAILTPSAGNGCTPANNSTCSSTLTPVIRLKNYGSTNLTSVTIFTQVDGAAPVAYSWTGNVAPNATINVSLPAIVAAVGNHTIKIYVANPNGAADGRITNDTQNSTFTILNSTTTPLTEGFESTTFPPNGWQIIDPNTTGLTWERTTVAAKTGVASARIRFYDYLNGDNHVDYLLSPPVSVTANEALTFSFERAYKLFSTDETYFDSLAVVLSYDCGKTFTEIWKRSGAGLASVPGTTEDEFVPASNEWANAFVNLQPYLTTNGNIVIGFKATNRYGNNLYIDNVNIGPSGTIITDATITGIESPFTHECTHNIIPEVALRNNGNDVLTETDIVLLVDNTIVQTIQWTGSLDPGDEITVTGNNTNVAAAGNHTFTAYTRSPNNLPDNDLFNDTARIRFIVHDVQPLPVREGFESAGFPPVNWSVISSGHTYTWEKTNRAATEGSNSAWIRFYRFEGEGRHDDLFSPLMQATEFDSLKVSFDVAHTRLNKDDTLEILLTKDCGHTFESIYKKWGNALQTTGGTSPSFPPGDTVGFVPTASQWRRDSVNFTEKVAANNNFMLVFRATSNNGNNIFLDRINIEPVTLAERLKKNGFIITPNPFNNIFVIRHLVAPTALRSVVISNTAGQIVYRQDFRGDAGNYIEVNLGRYSSGMYNVKLIYSYTTVNVKMLKL